MCLASSRRGDLWCLIYPSHFPLLLSLYSGVVVYDICSGKKHGKVVSYAPYRFSRAMVIGVLWTFFALILCAMSIWEMMYIYQFNIIKSNNSVKVVYLYRGILGMPSELSL